MPRATILQRQERARIIANGLTPLGVMMENMAFWRDEVGLLQAKIDEARPKGVSVLQMENSQTLERYLDARGKMQEAAEKAAPYVHARISPMVVRPPDDPLDPAAAPRLADLTDEEIDAAERIARKLSDSFGNPAGKAAP